MTSPPAFQGDAFQNDFLVPGTEPAFQVGASLIPSRQIDLTGRDDSYQFFSGRDDTIVHLVGRDDRSGSETGA